MNKRLLTLCMLLAAVTVGTVAATVEINSYNFPDVRFRAYLKTADFNSNGDNELTDAEIKNATMLEVNEKGITNLKGIEFFTSMWFLDCSDNDLQSLDVSKNTKLTMLACANNKLKSLDVSKNTSLGFLACYNNKLTALDLTKNTVLAELDCFLNQIRGESMDALIASLPQGTDCEFVAVSDGDLEQNVCTGPQAAAAKQKGWNLSCWYCNSFVANPFEGGVTINEYNFPDVTFRSEVLSLDTDADGMLADKDIKKKDMFYLVGKGITDLTGIEYFTALTKLYCHENSLNTLNVSKNKALTNLNCRFNNIKSLDVSNNTALVDLRCDVNILESLDVTKNTALTRLDCCSNSLQSLDVLKNTALIHLDCAYNSLKSLNVSNNTALVYLRCKDCDLESLDVTKNTALTELNCSDNSLESLDVTKNTALTRLYCGFNNLKTLDVSKNTVLTELYCYVNSLESLDVTKNTALEVLYCYTNGLKSLDVTKNTKLEQLSCYWNKIKGSSMDNLVNSLPDTQGTLIVFSDYANEENVITKVQVKVATGKGWKVQKYAEVEKNKWKEVDYAGVSVDIPIDATNFPDDNFRNYVSTKADVNKNGILSDDEIKEVQEIQVTSKSIKNLKGIEYFTALTSLYCVDNKLSTLDVSKNTSLTTIACYSNLIKGAQMDALIASLPTVSRGRLCVIDPFDDSEQNVCTIAQVIAAKKKGWNVLKWMDPMSYPYGDVNGDDVVDKKDLNALASYIMGVYDGFVADIDINNDGKVDAADIVALVNILNGK